MSSVCRPLLRTLATMSGVTGGRSLGGEQADRKARRRRAAGTDRHVHPDTDAVHERHAAPGRRRSGYRSPDDGIALARRNCLRHDDRHCLERARTGLRGVMRPDSPTSRQRARFARDRPRSRSCRGRERRRPDRRRRWPASGCCCGFRPVGERLPPVRASRRCTSGLAGCAQRQERRRDVRRCHRDRAPRRRPGAARRAGGAARRDQATEWVMVAV